MLTTMSSQPKPMKELSVEDLVKLGAGTMREKGLIGPSQKFLDEQHEHQQQHAAHILQFVA